MHFRDRGRSVQLVRTTYDPDTKKPRTEVVGRLARPGLEVTDAIRGKLTPQEIEEIEAYKGRNGRREAVAREFAASQFADTLKLVTEWLASASPVEAEAFAGEIHKPFGKLRRQIASIGAGEEPQRSADKSGSGSRRKSQD